MGNATHPAALYQLRKVTRILALIILVVIVVGLFLPTDYRVERSIVIDASQDEIQQKMFRGDYLPNWMFVQNGKVDSFEGVLNEGDSVALSYDDVAEQGLLSLVELSYRSVLFDVRPKPKMNQVHNEISFQSNGGSGTEVAWVIEGDLSVGLLGPYLALFANDIAGNNFEKSLQQLKEVIELSR
ncbi:polyketide cyclase [Marinomonas ushuaiensis DSM 15871]|uniref:Polyketide cyclase n=1 Tax=Marinomonas ushuaiensis DSM 15871 TaxID=1122207 RepID=X7E9F7_9GAMM|nr:polyketide cyclase [Marinomonas ushuaiensis]ETX11778.1 polyketide cyclase [Marinomonas ushuaiensis DSM 15871]